MFMKRTLISVFVVTAVLLSLLVSSCDIAAGNTDIGAIRKTPAQFEGKKVRISGSVENVVEMPFINKCFYTVKDKTGVIVVLTDDKAPDRGTKIVVRGVVGSSAIVGERGFGVHVRETKRG